MTETTPTISRKRRFKTRRDTDRRGADKETTPMESENRELNIFISYATEDTKIADSVYRTLTTVLDSDFSKIFLAKISIESGLDFEEEIKKNLDKTDILILIYTGVEKPSHSYTGWEVGYFTKVIEESDSETKPSIVPLYLNELPPTASNRQGVHLGLKPDTLYMSSEEFNDNLIKDIGKDHSMVTFLNDLQKSVNKIRVERGFENNPLLDTVQDVRKMLYEIFVYLKDTIDKKLTPQKKIIIEINNALQPSDDDLPSDAKLRPDGTGDAMTVFGLSSDEITWSQFTSGVKNSGFGDSWCAAIVRVITSSLPNQIDVDNSQIIVSKEAIYRLILTTSTTYYNGKREFHLYLVKSPSRKDYGDRDTTLLLKGLEIVCRFRFMFLETESVFYSKNFLAMRLDEIPSLAQDMIMELDLLVRDSLEAGLDKPHVWSKFIEWDPLLKMSQNWQPHEDKIQDIVKKIKLNKNNQQDLVQLRKELADALEDMERTTRQDNMLLIEQMTDALRRMVHSEERTINVDLSRSRVEPHLVASSNSTDGPEHHLGNGNLKERRLAKVQRGAKKGAGQNNDQGLSDSAGRL